MVMSARLSVVPALGDKRVSNEAGPDERVRDRGHRRDRDEARVRALESAAVVGLDNVRLRGASAGSRAVSAIDLVISCR